MRTYGRVYAQDGTLVGWEVVTSNAVDGDDYVWLTTLIQCLKLSPGESPFYANYGIPAVLSVIQQVFPDIFVALAQSQFSRYFASLIISRTSNAAPVYKVNVLTHQGVPLARTIPV